MLPEGFVYKEKCHLHKKIIQFIYKDKSGAVTKLKLV